MPANPGRLSKFWNELQRRNVLRSVAVYAGSAFIILEAATIIFPRWGLPDWSIDLVLYLLILGGLINIVVAWIFDITPQGVERTKPITESEETRGAAKAGDSNSWKVATYISLVVIVGLIVLNVIPGNRKVRAGEIDSLVILPFENFTGDDQLENIVSGMHSSLIGDMGRVSGLRVIGSTSSNVYKNSDIPLPQIANELNVDAVVEPTVMCYGDTICIQIRVITPFPEERQLWVADYKAEKSQILNLYNQVTRQIADEVRVELTSEEEKMLAQTISVVEEAYEAYLTGKYYWEQLGDESIREAEKYFTIATEKDPDLAPPYAWLAMIWHRYLENRNAPSGITLAKCEEYVNKALELAPDDPEVHFLVAGAAVWHEYDWDKGEKEFLKALAINPNHVLARIYYSHLLMILQRSDEALIQGKLAADLDPMNALVQALYAVVLLDAGQYQKAYEYASRATSLDPDNHFAFRIEGRAAYLLGSYDEAFEHAKKNLPFETNIVQSIDRIYKEKGRLAAYEEISRQLELLAQERYVQPTALAFRYYQIGQYSKALDWFEKAYELRDFNITYMTTGVDQLDHLFDSTRFVALLEKLNLPPPLE